MVFEFLIKRTFEKTKENLHKGIKLKELDINILVESSCYLDKHSQDFTVYYRVDKDKDFFTKEQFLLKINRDVDTSASTRTILFVYSQFIFEIENKIVPKILEFKEYFSKFIEYNENYNRGLEKEIKILCNSLFIKMTRDKFKYDIVEDIFIYNEETFISEITQSGQVDFKFSYDKKKYNCISIYDIELNFSSKKIKYYLTGNLSEIFLVEKPMKNLNISELFSRLGKSFNIYEMSEFIKNEEIIAGKFLRKYNSLLECKKEFIRKYATENKYWLLLSGKVINLPIELKAEPSKEATEQTLNNEKYVSVKDIFILSNRLETENILYSQFKKILENR